ncbi:MAG: hypothetical protein ACAH83_12695 [Alphaproteobacteria bacterium]
MAKTRRKTTPKRAASPVATAGTDKRNVFLIFAAAVYTVAVIYSIWHGVSHPVRNWDMMGYIACIVSDGTDDPKIIHERMLAEIKPVVWPELYTEYSEKNRLSADAGNFYRQIPFYRIKPLYVWAVRAVHAMGAGLAASTWLVSTFSFVVLSAALAWWRPDAANRGAWLLSLCALLLLGYLPLGTFAGYSTPDPLSLMFFTLAFMLWARRRSLAGYAVCNLLCVLTRPDALIQTIILTLYFMLFSAKDLRMKPSTATIAAGTACAGFIAVQLATSAPGWITLFVRGFIDDNFDFTAGEAHLTIGQYFSAIFAGLKRELINPRFIFFVLLSAGALAEAYRRRKTARLEWVWLIMAGWTAFGARLLLFPATDERYFYGYYLLMIIGSIELLSPLAEELLRRKNPAADTARKLLSWRL